MSTDVDNAKLSLDCDELTTNEIEMLRSLLDELQELRPRLGKAEHKARQYDSVVQALQVTDGGRYRADTIDALVQQLRRLAAVRAILAELVTLHDQRPDDYHTRKPLAWQAARNLLREGE
jgi:hypothetical protein